MQRRIASRASPRQILDLPPFLRAHYSGRYLVAIADLHQSKIPALCVDPNVDGSGGTVVTLQDALAQVDTAKIKFDGQ